MLKLYRCPHCGNIIEMVENSGVPVVCCGEPMQYLDPNTTDAATEKHVPVINLDGNKVEVVIGSVEHPMVEEHHISFIILETDLGIQRKHLNPTGEPKATFMLVDGEKVVAAYEYCNIHGFWKASL
ncbi:superoxide reductase [Clostridiales Family XIII bacterium PM5-7]